MAILVAQRIEQAPNEGEVAGSSPAQATEEGAASVASSSLRPGLADRPAAAAQSSVQGACARSAPWPWAAAAAGRQARVQDVQKLLTASLRPLCRSPVTPCDMMSGSRRFADGWEGGRRLELWGLTLGDLLGLIGIAIAIWQIVRTGRMVTATKKAVEENARQLGIYNLLLIIPELARVESDLERSAHAGQLEGVRRSLKDWRELASDLRGLVDGRQDSSEDLLPLIQQSLTLSIQAKTRLAIANEDTDLIASTKKVRHAIEMVCLETRTLGAQVRVALNVMNKRADTDVTNLGTGRNGE
jgi:hypothetical protein